MSIFGLFFIWHVASDPASSHTVDQEALVSGRIDRMGEQASSWKGSRCTDDDRSWCRWC